MNRLENKDIVCVALPNWEGDYVKSTVKIISELATSNRVLYVDYEHTWKDVFAAWIGKSNAPANRILGFSNRLRTVEVPGGKPVHVLTPPPVYPANWITSDSFYESVMKANANKVRKSILKAMETLNMKNPVVINAFNPFFGLPLAKTLNESALIYYCYDEISACKWSKKHGKKVEEAFMKKADAVITTSEGLLNQKSQLAKACFMVNNGVDFSLFNKAADLKFKNKNSEITVGYLGSIDERLDYDLLSYLAENMPDTKFQFVGRIVEKEKAARVDKFTNVRFFGPKKLEELPPFLRNFDVALIPFVKNEQTANIYPVKINEYLAAGVPVVSTDFAPLPKFSDIISMASTNEDFLRQVNYCLNNDSIEKREKRVALAENNSWEKRGEQFGEIVSQVLASKYQQVSMALS